MIFRFLLFVVSCILFINVDGQFAVLDNFTVNDGLPSSRVYDMLQDSALNMWFATENGVSRYDGKDFRNYTTLDGLPDNSTVKLYLDYKGRVWFLSYEGLLSYFINDTIHTHWINDSLIKYQVSFFDKMYIGADGLIYLSHFGGGLVTADENDHSINIIVNDIGAGLPYWHSVFYVKKKHGIITGSIKKQNIDVFKLHNFFPDIKYIHIENDRIRHFLHKYLILTSDSIVYASIGPKLLGVKSGDVFWEHDYKNEIITIYCDSQNNLWVSEAFMGLYMYPNSDVSKEPITFLKNNTISNILEDHEGNYWFSTAENGVFIVPSVQFHVYDKKALGIENNVILKLHNIDDRLFFSTSNKGFHSAIISGTKVQPLNNFNLEGESFSNINDFIITSKGDLWVPCRQYNKFNLNGKKLPLTKFNRYSGYSVLERLNGQIILGITEGYTIIDNSNLIIKSIDEGFGLKTFKISETKDSTLLLGTIKGLVTFKGGEYKRFDKNDAALNSRITDIKLNKDQIYVGTFDNGLVVINYNNKVHVDIISGLASNRIKVIFPENDSVIWIGTNKGLNKLVLNPGTLGISKYEKYTLSDGLPSNEINDIMKIDGNIWLATDKGLVSFNPAVLKVIKTKPIISLVNINVNGELVNPQLQDSQFRHNQDNITFNFKTHTYKKSGSVKYLYKLEGFESEWIETSGNSVRYSNLASGSYIFYVKAITNDIYVSDIASFRFKVNRYFLETFQFYILLLVLFIGVFFYSYHFWSKSLSKRDHLKRQIILAEQNAVRSQMNPHFIFNSLNSIQNFILDNDEKNANIYLVIFSSLIRRILEASKNNFISLKEEIEMIKLYLELERFRFDKQFDFEIILDQKINPDLVSIPSMILQPYLENAIWHGLVPKKGKGKLIIEVIKEAENILVITISDDGIGREKAAEISKKRKLHKPTGIKNVEERLQLLNKLNKTNMSVRIEDLYDEGYRPLGTKVEFIVDV
ncbi:MAG: histidine kinase [Bacteroidales bacterium]|nr:histidine kinase [Bacteroidales bacterium]